ncbi:MAG: protocatechuate 3,4-dioxygenase subunit beta, partial [Brevibacterium sp.]|nr:protocatechuate 3,4-dioxygenase subunit beta [Brevibacterium sp.]
MGAQKLSGSDDAAESQQTLSAEIETIETEHRNAVAAGTPAETQPRLDYPPYRSSILRHPTKDPRHTDPETIELFSPAFGHRDLANLESDLTIQAGGEPIGERIKVTGRVLDGSGRPVRNQLVEIWQANSAGRYIHKRDQHPAPIDPNFTGVGRTLTDDDGSYTFTTIKPGPYPWKNHHNAWRPAHIHFSLFGTEF